MSDINPRDAIAHRIRALLAKTTENGATEAEALAAAAKARQIMDAHRLTQSDIEVQEEPIDQEHVDRPTEQKTAAVDFILHGLDAYCGVQTWFHPVSARDKNGYHKWIRKLVIFGLRSDVEMAKYLYQMVASAIRLETGRFTSWPVNRGYDAAATRRINQSFQVGMARRVGVRLHEMAKVADATAVTSSGTALVVVKNAVVKQAYDALGLRFSRASRGSPGVRSRRLRGREGGWRPRQPEPPDRRRHHQADRRLGNDRATQRQ